MPHDDIAIGIPHAYQYGLKVILSVHRYTAIGIRGLGQAFIAMIGEALNFLSHPG